MKDTLEANSAKKAESESGKVRYPIVALNSGVIVTCLSLLCVTGLLFQMNAIYREVIQKSIEVNRLKGEILRLDEVLTMSARMSAATGDARWEERYLKNEGELDQAIARVLTLVPETASIKSTHQTEEANKRLVAMEKQAFNATREGRQDFAKELLMSQEYEDQKTIYAQGMFDLGQSLDKHVGSSLEQLQVKSMAVICIALGLIPLVFFSWLYVLRTLNQWRSFIVTKNKNLDHEVISRTEQLETEKIRSLSSAKMATLGEMAGGIAHEINNPLGIIQGFAEQLSLLCEDNLVLPVTRVQSIAEKIGLATDRITKIVQGLRSFSRDGSKDPMELASLQTIIEQTLSLCHERMQSRGIALRTKGLDRSFQISCRSVEVSQVLLNLLNNAVDATDGCDLKEIAIEVELTNDEIRVCVIDSGAGIPVHLRSKIMQPFFSTKPVGKGTGLGLSISRTIMAAHKGRLELDGSRGRTCFVMAFPRLPAALSRV